jgi:hypothetical protein
MKPGLAVTAACLLIAGFATALAAEDDAASGRINQGSVEVANPLPSTSGAIPNAIDDPAHDTVEAAKSSAVDSGAATAGPQNPAIGAAPPGAPPGSSPQTTPSTISAQNAAEDRLSIEQRRLQLTDSEKQALRSRILADEQGAAGTPDSRVAQARVGNVLPSSVAMYALPPQAVQQVPDVKDFKYVRAGDRLLIVDPESWLVVGVVQ